MLRLEGSMGAALVLEKHGGEDWHASCPNVRSKLCTARYPLSSLVCAKPTFKKSGAGDAAGAVGIRLLQTLVHTGQHNDANLSHVFFELAMPPSDVNLEVGSGSHPEQTAENQEPISAGRDLSGSPTRAALWNVTFSVVAALVCFKFLISTT